MKNVGKIGVGWVECGIENDTDANRSIASLTSERGPEGLGALLNTTLTAATLNQLGWHARWKPGVPDTLEGYCLKAESSKEVTAVLKSWSPE